MRRHVILAGKLLCVALMCARLLVGCSDNDDGAKGDPELGYIVNSTPYRVAIDIGLKNKYKWTLESGGIMSLELEANKTHAISVILYNNTDRVGEGFTSNFYINEIALDNKLRDFLCSWYYEILSTNGFSDKTGS